MRPNDHPSRAFTLIELLVVIAILALLVAMLMPVLGRVKEIARRVQCQANFKIVGSGVHVFAANHMGRAPSRASGPLGGSNGWGFLTFLYSERAVPKPVYTGGYPTKDVIACTSLKPDSLWWDSARSLLINQDMEGGPHPHPHCDPGNPRLPYEIGGSTQAGTCGAYVRPPPPGWDWYALGAPVQEFPRASWKVMIWEAGPCGTDYTYGYGDATLLTLGIDGTRPPYAGYGGYYSFRHVLPADKRQYQTVATACMLFVDSHVEIITAKANVNRSDRFLFKE